MWPDLDKHPVLHNRIITSIAALPFIGWLSGIPTLMVITSIIAGIAALPYFAVLADREHQDKHKH